MTPEEMQKMMEEQASKIEELTSKLSRVDDLEARVNPPQSDPDEAYKPKTWKELDEKVDRKAEEIALKVLRDADDQKKKIAEDEAKERTRQNEEIDAKLKKLEEEGIIEKTESKDDLGGRQRTQILGMTLKTGGTDIEAAGRALRTAWDAGLEYDYEKNEFRGTGTRRNTARDQAVPTSATRTPSVSKGQVDIRGVSGDLDEAQRRWEAAHR